jgi:hypothetical protein
MKALGLFFLFLVIGNDALAIQSKITQHRSRSLLNKKGQLHKTQSRQVLTQRTINSIGDLTPDDLVDLLFSPNGDLCLRTSAEFGQEMDAAIQSLREEIPTRKELLEENAIAKKVSTKIFVIDDIAGVLAAITAVVEIINSIKKFYGGLSEEKQIEMTSWQKATKTVLKVAKGKLALYKEEFGASYENSDLSSNLRRLERAINDLKVKAEKVIECLKEATSLGKWKLNGLGIAGLFFTFGINYAIISSDYQDQANTNRDRAYCTSKSMQADIAALDIVLNAVYDAAQTARKSL